jgi:hypothetical protein
VNGRRPLVEFFQADAPLDLNSAIARGDQHDF